MQTTNFVKIKNIDVPLDENWRSDSCPRCQSLVHTITLPASARSEHLLRLPQNLPSKNCEIVASRVSSTTGSQNGRHWVGTLSQDPPSKHFFQPRFHFDLTLPAGDRKGSRASHKQLKVTHRYLWLLDVRGDSFFKDKPSTLLNRLVQQRPQGPTVRDKSLCCLCRLLLYGSCSTSYCFL
ncbi:hypothetical protein BaRGS_00027993 [Batillaria attramentaria]|uniref:Uncharacterized protein n=1 Tax=Batillaria attramentaria TaxID=370345 RepID=A0ABD0K0Z3_9CAEN